MTGDEYVPTLAEIWDFLVGFKEATEVGFARLDGLARDVAELKGDVGELKGDVAGLKRDVFRLDGSIQSLERRVVRLDDRLSVFESQHVAVRLADHERRIGQLEARYT